MTRSARAHPSTSFRARRTGYPLSPYRPEPPPPPVALDEEEWSLRPPFRLVLPRDKRDRLAQHAARLAARRPCHVLGCHAEGMPVLLVESEREALLCPIHQLVQADGSRIEGEHMLATAAW